MKIIRYKCRLLIYALIVMQLHFITSCNTNSGNSKNPPERVGFLEFYLDMDYLKVKGIMDSLLNIDELQYFETADVLGNKQKSLYYNFAGINPSLYAKVNLRGTSLIDERLTNIQLTLCNKSKTANHRFIYNCDLNELNRLFELYKEKYGTPTLLDQGEKYDWLSKRISNIYFPGPKGRWALDKIYFWEKENYIIYFDFGYPESFNNSENHVTGSEVPELPDSTSAPIIYYDFTPDYINMLLDKASRMKEEE